MAGKRNKTQNETTDFIITKLGKKRIVNERYRKYGFPMVINEENKEGSLLYMEINNIKELITRPSNSHRIIDSNNKQHIIPSGWFHLEIKDNTNDWPERIKKTSEKIEINNETKRTYYFPFTDKDNEKIIIPLVIENVKDLYVRPSGTHRIVTKDGILHIVLRQWVKIEIE